MSIGDDDHLALVANWWEWHRLSRGNRAERVALEQGQPEPAWAAYRLISEQVAANSPGIVELLAALNDAAPVDDDGVTVGCGELENLLNEHGDAVIDEVETQAHAKQEFARAVAFVRISGGAVSDATTTRLKSWR
jgi:hypothetical protein